MTNLIFETINIDLASFLEASIGRTPSVFRDTGTGLATFQFSSTPGIESLIVAYSSGVAVSNVRRLLAARRRLFHEVRRVQREEQS